ARPQHDLVHLLRGARRRKRTTPRRRRRARRPDADRRSNGGADCPSGHRSAAARDGESLTLRRPMATAIAPGDDFAGRYRLLRKLGSGGMADVWLAGDRELGRRVAIKILPERYANREQFGEPFPPEAPPAARLSPQDIECSYA